MDKRGLFAEIKNILKWRLRNTFIDPFFIARWDIFPRMRRRMAICSSCEYNRKIEGELKIPVLIVTYKRPTLLKKTLESFLKLNRGKLDRFLIEVLVQGDGDEDTLKIIDKYDKRFHDVICTGVNLGCAGGYSVLIEEALKKDFPYFIYLQDDFLSNEALSNYLDEIIELLENNSDIGCIRLRSIKDRVNAYNIVSRKKIRYERMVGNVAIGNAHFTFNPTLARSSVIKKIVPTTSERDAMEKYQAMGLKTGQLVAECFSHIGHERAKNWIK